MGERLDAAVYMHYTPLRAGKLARAVRLCGASFLPTPAAKRVKRRHEQQKLTAALPDSKVFTALLRSRARARCCCHASEKHWLISARQKVHTHWLAASSMCKNNPTSATRYFRRDLVRGGGKFAHYGHRLAASELPTRVGHRSGHLLDDLTRETSTPPCSCVP